MFTHPGAKLLFMGGEFGQYEEWDFDTSLKWHVLEEKYHKGMQETLKALNRLYVKEKALYQLQFSDGGFQWIDHTDTSNSVFAYVRKGKLEEDFVVVVGNFTPNALEGYEIGVPVAGTYQEIFNSDSAQYEGSGMKACAEEGAFSSPKAKHSFEQSISLTLPPLGMVVLKIKDFFSQKK